DVALDVERAVGRTALAGGHGDPVALGHEGLGDRAADPAVAPGDQDGAGLGVRCAVRLAHSSSSSRNPTLMPTWKCSTLPSLIWPRTSVTSNQSQCRSVFAARSTPLWMAACRPSGEVPTISVTR